jgi:hypothetical protein
MNTNKIWMRLLMASTLLALLFTTACGMEKAIKGPAEQALAEQGDALMTCLKAGDFQAVYEMMSSDAQRDLDMAITSVGSLVDVKSIIKDVGSQIVKWTFEKASIVTINGTSRGTLIGKVVYIDGKSGKVRLEFEKQDDTWKVGSSSFTSQ